ncbi:MAG: transglutaminaseTgpA domain-containing protein [Succinivibrionaceae bacterium]
MIKNKALILIGITYIIITVMCSNHLLLLPASIAVIAILCRILVILKIIKPLTKIKVKLLTYLGITLLIIAGIIAHNIGDTFVNLLILGCALKFLEYGNLRDTYIQCCSMIFLSILPLIFHYEAYIAIYILIVPTLIIWSFISVTSKENIFQNLNTLLKLILPAIPLTIFLFIVFPRIGSLWVIPDKSLSKTGLSEKISINNVDELLKSSKMIGRVVFNDNIPSANERYFRAITYTNYDGIHWTEDIKTQNSRKQISYLKYSKNKNFFAYNKPYLNIKDPKREYTIIIEPSNTKFIPTLRYSISNDNNLFLLDDYNYTTTDPITTRSIFHFQYGKANTLTSKKELIEIKNNLLSYSVKQNPKTFELVNSIITEDMDDYKKVNTLLTFFKENKFFYTLSPGKYGINAIDEFLFQKRKGFCVHYAQSLTIMLRMANIPARMVGGYLGGEEKSSDNYVILRESDAHAWVEAFINHEWMVVDPTILISNYITNSRNTTNILIYKGDSLYEQTIYNIGNFIVYIKNTFEYIDLNWSMFILNFDTEKQQEIFKNNILYVIGFIIFSIGCSIGIIFLQQRNKKEVIKNPELKILIKVLKHLNKMGINKKDSDSLRTFITNLSMPSSQHIEIKDDILKNLISFLNVFENIRYNNLENKELLLNNLNILAKKIIKTTRENFYET